jgi:cytoskeletal protein CcmA (bactofilin family)
MSIFRRNPTAGASPGAAPAVAGDLSAPVPGGRHGTSTLIAPGTRIRGEVSGSTDVQIEGEVEGEVAVEALVVVGAGGSVRGPLRGRMVRVAGRVAGTVTAAERLEVAATGSVEGDLAAPRVVIAEGAFFKGKIEMRSDNIQEPRRPAGAGAEAASAAANEAGSD